MTDPGPGPDEFDDALRTLASRPATSTRDRQLAVIASAYLAGDRRRAEALARDHLVDHPDDPVVRRILRARRWDLDDPQGPRTMPTPTFDQLVQFRVEYVDSWNAGDKERFAANWRQFLADDDAFQMFDPVGTPMKRGLVGCALEPFDLWQPVVRFNVPKETFFICGNEIAWVMENFYDDGGTEVKSSSIENYTFTEDRQIHIRTWYIVPSGGPLAEQISEYLPEGSPNSP